MDNDAVEALTVTRPKDLDRITYWVHDAHFDYEEASFSKAASCVNRAVVDRDATALPKNAIIPGRFGAPRQ